MSGDLISASDQRVGANFDLQIEPFDVKQTLDGGQAFGWYRSADGSYRGVLGDRVVAIGCDGQRIYCRVETDDNDADIKARVEDYLVASADVDRLRSTLSGEPGYGEEVWKKPLIRVMRQDPWECVAGFICSQNSNIPRIKQMVASVARLGRRIGDEDWAFEFPSPSVVAEAGEMGLRAIGLGYRGKHLAPQQRYWRNR